MQRTLTTESYFKSFGLDVKLFCQDQGKTVGELVPDSFNDLRIDHITSMMELIEPKCSDWFKLNSMLTPRDMLNENSVLGKRIWRYLEYSQVAYANLDTAKRIALTLCENLDVLYDRVASEVLPQPKIQPGAFRGASCFLHFPRSTSVILHSQPTFPMTNKELNDLEKTIKRNFNVDTVRSFVSIYLAAGDIVPCSDWIVDADDLEPGHVTLAVAKILPADSPAELQRKVRISSLEDLPWKLNDEFLILKAEAEWRDDFLPGDDRWSNIILVLNMILREGDIDDFLAVWAIHEFMEKNVVGKYAKRNDIVRLFQRIHCVFESFKCSDQFDFNDPAPELHQAISDIQLLITL
jgi:hypothetical protein